MLVPSPVLDTWTVPRALADGDASNGGSDADFARTRVLDLAAGAFSSRVVHLAAELRLADHLAVGVWSATELAERTQTHADALERLLRTLAALGLVEHRRDGRFALTADGQALRSDGPASARAGIRVLASWWETWAELEHSVRTGRPAADVVLGKPAFDAIGEDPAWLAVFQEGMRGLNARWLPRLAGAIGDVGRAHVMDVAGGHGSLLAAVLGRSPDASGEVFDRPEVVPDARAWLDAQGLAARVRVTGGDMFRTVPAGADTYLLKWILHDWDDLDSVRLLRVLRAAMTPRSELLVVERVLPERVRPGMHTLRMQLSDLRMLAALGGRERTLDQLERLFAAAGLRLVRHTATGTPLSVLTVRRDEEAP